MLKNPFAVRTSDDLLLDEPTKTHVDVGEQVGDGHPAVAGLEPVEALQPASTGHHASASRLVMRVASGNQAALRLQTFEQRVACALPR